VVMDSVTEPVTIVKDSAAPTTYVTEDEVTMAQALAALKSSKLKVMVQEQEMSTTIPDAATIVTTDVPTPRAKGIIFYEQKQSQIPTVSSSKDKGRMIEKIDQNAKIALDDETQERTNDDEMFRVDDLAGEEVVMDSVTEPVTIVKDSAAPT
nr:hypothetical protein [Tanacetum cinerariifolium]